MSVPTVYHIGPFHIYLYGLALATAILVGTGLTLWEARRLGLDADRLADLVLYLLTGGLLGARLLYVLLEPGPYLANPLEIVMIQHGGLSFHGAILGGTLAGYWQIRRNRWSFWRLADLFAPTLALGYAITRVGCDIFGAPATVPWAVRVGGVLRHPVQLYSSLSSYLIFILLWKFRNRTRYPGQLFLLYVILYSASRILIEMYRVSPTLVGPVTVAQAASLAAVAGAGLVMRLLARKA